MASEVDGGTRQITKRGSDATLLTGQRPGISIKLEEMSYNSGLYCR